MPSEDIKARIQAAYVKALENRHMQRHRHSGISDLFRDVKLYGREAGVDFIGTHLQRIVHEAVETAECKEASLDLTAYGFGLAALEGMAQALRDLTSLKIEVNKATIRMIWAEASPGLV